MSLLINKAAEIQKNIERYRELVAGALSQSATISSSTLPTSTQPSDDSIKEKIIADLGNVNISTPVGALQFNAVDFELTTLADSSVKLVSEGVRSRNLVWNELNRNR